MMRLITLLIITTLLSTNAQVFRNYSADESLLKKSIISKRRHVLRLYRADGTIEVESEYHNDRREGLTKEYYPNGMLKSEIYFKNGREDGTARFYSSNGVVKTKIIYERGEIEEIINYDKDGHELPHSK